jgi:hypothetical protein
MAHNGRDPGEREPLVVYWYEYRPVVGLGASNGFVISSTTAVASAAGGRFLSSIRRRWRPRSRHRRQEQTVPDSARYEGGRRSSWARRRCIEDLSDGRFPAELTKRRRRLGQRVRKDAEQRIDRPSIAELAQRFDQGAFARGCPRLSGRRSARGNRFGPRDIPQEPGGRPSVLHAHSSFNKVTRCAATS